MAAGRGGAARNTTARRRRPRTSWGRRVATFFGVLTTLLLLGTLGAMAYLGAVFHSVTRDLPAPEQLVNYDPGGATEIYATDKDKNGKPVVLARVFIENRERVSIQQVSRFVRDATIAVEDERFYQHPGVDLKALARMVYVNAMSRRLEQGGSTLTQQLARNVYLSRRKTISRKAQEMMLALQIEKNFSKEQILELYLNEVYYGSGAYGIQAAAKTYFGRPASKLSLSQAALLAGLPQNPPVALRGKTLEWATARRNLVLAKMAEQGYVKPAQAEVAKRNGVFLAKNRLKQEREYKAPYFVNTVVQQLVDRYGSDKVFKGGLRVYTTLNWKMQQEAERALRNGVAYARRAGVTEGALVCLEPRTGYIRALVGGVDYERNQYNNVVQGRRQPGSAFKPIVYAAAVDSNPRRWGEYRSVDNSRIGYGRGRKKYRPSGSGPGGLVSMRTALTYSYNNAAVNTANTIGIGRVVDYARRLGVTSPLRPDLSLALGSHEVTPLEMAAVYSVFATGGDRAAPMGIIRVLNHAGETLEQNVPQVEKAVIGQSTTEQIGDMLASVVERGTAARARGIHEVGNAHGKTGTTNDNKDAWFVGYTPQLSAAVWVCGAQWVKQGNRAVVKSYRPMAGVTGGQVCAPIWARFMKAAVPIQKNSGEPAAPAPRVVSAPTFAPTERPGPARDSLLADASAWGDAEDVARRRSRSTPDTAAASPLARRTTEVGLRAPAAAAGGESPPTAPAPPDTRPSSESAEPSDAAGPTDAPAVAAAAAVSSRRFVPRRVTTAIGGTDVASAPPRPVFAAVTPAPAPPPAVVPAIPRLVSVSICADSGRRATRWCPETVTHTVAAPEAPRGRCRLHKPRPGDG